MTRHGWIRVRNIVPLAVLFIAAIGWVVMALWNWLVPALFGLHEIGYWQAWGLLILCKILFGGFHGAHDGRWRHRMMERCEHMTPEEREKFRQAFMSRWGHGEPPQPPPNAGDLR